MTATSETAKQLLKPLLSVLSVAGAVALFLVFLALRKLQDKLLRVRISSLHSLWFTDQSLGAVWVATYHTGLQQLPIVRELLGKAKKDPRKQQEAAEKLRRLQDKHRGKGLARARSASGQARASADGARLPPGT